MKCYFVISQDRIWQLTVSFAFYLLRKTFEHFGNVTGFTGWLHSDVRNLFACCSSPPPSQSPLLSSWASAPWKIDDCWPWAIPGVMNCALLWFVMRHNTSSFLLSIHTHTSESLNYWWIRKEENIQYAWVTTVAFLEPELRVQSEEIFLLHMLKLELAFLSPLMTQSPSALSSGSLIKGRCTSGMSADCN